MNSRFIKFLNKILYLLLNFSFPNGVADRHTITLNKLLRVTLPLKCGTVSHELFFGHWTKKEINFSIRRWERQLKQEEREIERKLERDR